MPPRPSSDALRRLLRSIWGTEAWGRPRRPRWKIGRRGCRWGGCRPWAVPGPGPWLRPRCRHLRARRWRGCRCCRRAPPSSCPRCLPFIPRRRREQRQGRRAPLRAAPCGRSWRSSAGGFAAAAAAAAAAARPRLTRCLQARPPTAPSLRCPRTRARRGCRCCPRVPSSCRRWPGRGRQAARAADGPTTLAPRGPGVGAAAAAAAARPRRRRGRRSSTPCRRGRCPRASRTPSPRAPRAAIAELAPPCGSSFRASRRGTRAPTVWTRLRAGVLW